MSRKYSIQQYIRKHKVYRLCERDTAWAEIVPELGNNCWAFHAHQNSVLEQITFEQFLSRPKSYSIPILFPYPNRIRDGKFCFRGKCYTVESDYQQHGFVRHKCWDVDETGASNQDGAWIKSSLKSEKYEDIRSQFPCPFLIEVTYRLKDGMLEMNTTVRNMGKEDMPLGFGIHPYFRLPEQGSIQIPAQKRWELDDDLLPTGRILDVAGKYDLRKPTDLSNLVLDDEFTELTEDEDGFVRCKLNDEKKQIQTIIEFDATNFRNVVVYTPPAPRQAICIEPYSCPTDAFNLHNKKIDSHLIILKPNDMVNFKLRSHVSEQKKKYNL